MQRTKDTFCFRKSDSGKRRRDLEGGLMLPAEFHSSVAVKAHRLVVAAHARLPRSATVMTGGRFTVVERGLRNSYYESSADMPCRSLCVRTEISKKEQF